jgi:hypothetical protein
MNKPTAEKTATRKPRVSRRPLAKGHLVEYLEALEEYREDHNLGDIAITVLLHEAEKEPIEFNGVADPMLDKDREGMVFMMRYASDPILAPDRAPLTLGVIMQQTWQLNQCEGMPAKIHIELPGENLCLDVCGARLVGERLYFDCRKHRDEFTFDWDQSRCAALHRSDKLHYHLPAPCLAWCLEREAAEAELQVLLPGQNEERKAEAPLFALIEPWGAMPVGTMFALADSSVPAPPNISRRQLTVGRMVEMLPKETALTVPVICSIFTSLGIRRAVLDGRECSSSESVRLKTRALCAEAAGLDAFLSDLWLASPEDFAQRWAPKLAAWFQDGDIAEKIEDVIQSLRCDIDRAAVKGCFRSAATRKLAQLLRVGFSPGWSGSEEFHWDLAEMAPDEETRRIIEEAMARQIRKEEQLRLARKASAF